MVVSLTFGCITGVVIGILIPSVLHLRLIRNILKLEVYWEETVDIFNVVIALSIMVGIPAYFVILDAA
jgi:hypothetical protein